MPVAEKEVKLSERTTVVLKPVNMLEKMQTDAYATALAAKAGSFPDMAFKFKCAAIGSIRSMNGNEKRPLANLMEFQALAQDLDGGLESLELENAYGEQSGLFGVSQEGNGEATPSA